MTKTNVGGLPSGSYIVTDNSAVIAQLNERIAELEEERRDDYSEASTYATSLFNTYYKNKPDAVDFELCTSVAAIITQIDNMATGVIADFERSRKDLIEEFAEAECMGDLAKIARNHGYVEQGK